jgi:hypothetical protein
MSEPNEPIDITSGPANLNQQMANADPVIAGRGTLALEWTPYPGVIASFSADVGPEVHIGVGTSVLSFAGREVDVTIDQYPAGSRWSNGARTIEARGRVTSPFVESTRPLVRLTTHLVNFPTFFWREPPDQSWLDGVRLIAGGWEIVLQTVVGYERILALKRSSGYCLTHVCQVKRIDDSEFSAQDAEHLLEGLLYFFSFARAAWATPVLSVGHDAEHAVALRQFFVWNTSPGRWFPTWMDDQHPQSLMELLPGFWARWTDDQDRETLRRAAMSRTDQT